jgi:hypothetical protein
MNERLKELYTQALEYAYSKVPLEHRYNDIFYALRKTIIPNQGHTNLGNIMSVWRQKKMRLTMPLI